MIRVRKRTTPPATLRDGGVVATSELKTAYDAHPAAYRDGSRGFDFDAALYGGDDVKTALIEDQHAKCAYCESKITHVAYGDVEHYRPKKGYRQATGAPLGKPGYYWLAYAWDNLYLACPVCNRTHKKSDFPLADPTTRAVDHLHDLSNELPLVVRPDEEADVHVGFYEDEAYGRTERGRTTVAVVGLNREALAEARRTHLKNTKRLARLLPALQGSGHTAHAESIAIELRRRLDDAAEYAGMIRALHASSPIV